MALEEGFLHLFAYIIFTKSNFSYTEFNMGTIFEHSRFCLGAILKYLDKEYKGFDIQAIPMEWQSRENYIRFPIYC